MLTNVLYITVAYFLLGAAAIVCMGRSNGGKSWTKYFVYLLIVCCMVAGSQFKQVFIAIAVLIGLGGLYELTSVFVAERQMKAGKFLISLLVYLLLAFGFMMYSGMENENRRLFLYVLVFTFDGFSQVTGQLFGKHKLLANISPNKTVEGLIGGSVFTMLTALLLTQFVQLSISAVLILSLCIIFSALAGDLLASWFKRLNHVKDYSRLIPGHGGLLDRFDSFIAAGSVYVSLMLLF